VATTVPPVLAAMPESFAAPDVLDIAEAIELFDVVCSVDSVLERSLDFGVAQSTARKHNKTHPGHDAKPIRQLQ
jgi:hypothetical protein